MKLFEIIKAVEDVKHIYICDDTCTIHEITSTIEDGEIYGLEAISEGTGEAHRKDYHNISNAEVITIMLSTDCPDLAYYPAGLLIEIDQDLVYEVEEDQLENESDSYASLWLDSRNY